jgi:hypothetical protein
VTFGRLLVKPWNPKSRPFKAGFFGEATTGFEPVNGGFADLCLTSKTPRRRAGRTKLMPIEFSKKIQLITAILTPNLEISKLV